MNNGTVFDAIDELLLSPGHYTTGFGSEARIGQLPPQTAETMANRWSFSLMDKANAFPDGELLAWKSTHSGMLLRLPPPTDGPDRIIEITVGER